LILGFIKNAKPHVALCLNDPDVVRVLSSRLEADFKVSFAHSIDRLHSISLSSSLFDPTVVSAFLSARSDVEFLIEHWSEIDEKRASERAH
jgi:hypothetical protein